MSIAKNLVFDCESGGIGEDISLLTAHFAVTDEDWNIIDELSLFLKPKEVDETGCAIYKVTAGGLGVNKINIVEHDKTAITKSEAGQKLREFLWKYKPKEDWLAPMGKNIDGDIRWVNNHILGAPEWRKYVSYRTYDITTVIRYLKRKGKLAADAPEGLEKLANFLGLQFDAHTASGDVHASIFVMKYLENL
jgi:oligoribonuclease (3'-5' exoribonuclease)